MTTYKVYLTCVCKSTTRQFLRLVSDKTLKYFSWLRLEEFVICFDSWFHKYELATSLLLAFSVKNFYHSRILKIETLKKIQQHKCKTPHQVMSRLRLDSISPRTRLEAVSKPEMITLLVCRSLHFRPGHEPESIFWVRAGDEWTVIFFYADAVLIF